MNMKKIAMLVVLCLVLGCAGCAAREKTYEDTVQEILELYQEQTGEDWASRNADNAEVNRLRRNLENTTRQAQFRTTFFKKW